MIILHEVQKFQYLHHKKNNAVGTFIACLILRTLELSSFILILFIFVFIVDYWIFIRIAKRGQLLMDATNPKLWQPGFKNDFCIIYLAYSSNLPKLNYTVYRSHKNNSLKNVIKHSIPEGISAISCIQFPDSIKWHVRMHNFLKFTDFLLKILLLQNIDGFL